MLIALSCALTCWPSPCRLAAIPCGVNGGKSAAAADAPGPLVETKDTPKICLEMGTGLLAAGQIDEAGIRRIKQLGVDHVLSGGPAIPWQVGSVPVPRERHGQCRQALSFLPTPHHHRGIRARHAQPFAERVEGA